MEAAVGQIGRKGENMTGTMLFGDIGAEPRAGVTALGSLGIEIDVPVALGEEAPGEVRAALDEMLVKVSENLNTSGR